MTPNKTRLQEIWKPVLGYEGLYEVSNIGNVRSKKGNLKPMPNATGYLRVTLYKNRAAKSKTIHSLVLTAFVSERPLGFASRHLDGNRKNNSIDNLAWVINKENHADKRIQRICLVIRIQKAN